MFLLAHPPAADRASYFACEVGLSAISLDRLVNMIRKQSSRIVQELSLSWAYQMIPNAAIHSDQENRARMLVSQH
jgi:hypothetical protein